MSKEIVFALAIFLPQYNPLRHFSFGMMRLRRMTLPLKNQPPLVHQHVFPIPLQLTFHSFSQMDGRFFRTASLQDR
jgi:hypothetical protein